MYYYLSVINVINVINVIITITITITYEFIPILFIYKDILYTAVNQLINYIVIHMVIN